MCMNLHFHPRLTNLIEIRQDFKHLNSSCRLNVNIPVDIDHVLDDLSFQNVASTWALEYI